MSETKKEVKLSPLREKLFEIIFEADTTAGKRFDVILMVLIVASVLVVIVETVQGWSPQMELLFLVLEWIFTIVFTIEYILRLYVVLKPIKYATSFFGIIDLASILPTYFTLLGVGAGSLMVIRIFRLLRVFRIFRLAAFLKESRFIMDSLKASRQKIAVFLTFVLLMVITVGSIMYVVEGSYEGIEGVTEESKFTSIPTSIYWAIVTLTTVGYGDIAPQTPLGQFLSSILMIMGYAVIAVPTGIVSAEMAGNGKKKKKKKEVVKLNTQVCQSCGEEEHADDSFFCRICGQNLHREGDEF